MTAKKLAVMTGHGEGAATAAKLAIVTAPETEGGKVLLDVGALDPALRTKVAKWYGELHTAMADYGKAGLKVGKVLSEARAELKPLGIWMAFLNRIPGLSAKTGDRFIKRYEMAQRHISGTILGIAMATGIDLAGEEETQPFGKYTKAVKKVGPPPKDTGTPEKNVERARVWLAKVMVIYANQRKRAREEAEKIDPTVKASEQLVQAIENYVDDKAGQVNFLKRVLKKVLRRLGYSDLIVTRSQQVEAVREAEKAKVPA